MEQLELGLEGPVISDEPMYVVLFTNEAGKDELCYWSSKQAFIGPYDQAKVVLAELQEWQPECKYRICKIGEMHNG